jgi:hypothetical protein
MARQGHSALLEALKTGTRRWKNTSFRIQNAFGRREREPIGFCLRPRFADNDTFSGSVAFGLIAATVEDAGRQA